jgi:transposase-like protein
MVTPGTPPASVPGPVLLNAEDRRHALEAVTAFDAVYGVRFPKAVGKITDDVDKLLAFYDYPAEHWIHLRTTTRSSRPSPPFGTARR